MAEIYIGDQQISGGGSGGGGTIDTSGFVDVSTWDEHEKVIASALVDLKSLEDKIEEFDESIQAQENALLAEVHVVQQQKADASVVYTKTEIDKSDKVVAAALAELNDRVSTLESSSGGGSGETFDPSYLETGLLDVSTRVDALEQNDYVETNDLSAFLTADDVSNFITDNDISTLAYKSMVCFRYMSYGSTSTQRCMINTGIYGSSNIDQAVNENIDKSVGEKALILGLGHYTNKLQAKGNYSTNIGYCNKTNGDFSISLGGSSNTTTGTRSIVGGLNSSVGGAVSFGVGYEIRTNNVSETALCRDNISNTGGSLGSSLNTLCSIGNGSQDSSRHNAFEVRQSGDIYIPDVSASGEYYEKPMINLQQKIYELEARIAVLESAIQTQ